MRKWTSFAVGSLFLAFVFLAAPRIGAGLTAKAGTGAAVEPVAYLPVILASGLSGPISGTTLQVGPGFSDVSTHQVLRTSGDRVYIVTGELYRKPLHIYRADVPGTPTAFGEPDQAHQPQAQDTISSVDAAIDGGDVIHVIWLDNAGPIWYQTFDTNTDTWGTRQQLADSPWPSSTALRQGSEGVALALDGGGGVHAIYTKVSGGKRGLYYNNNAGGAWTHEQRLDDQPAYDNGHPALAFGQEGKLYTAWLTERGVNHGDIRIRARSASGTWAAGSTLIAADQFADAIYSIDQGPSLLITPDGQLHIAYIGAYEPVSGAPGGYAYGRIHHQHSADGLTWTADDPPTTHYTHNPSLATDAAGTLYLFGHEEAWLHDSCASLYFYERPAGAAWPSDWSLLTAGCVDSSVSAKWSANFWNHQEIVDIVYWTQQEPNILYYKLIP